MIKIRVLHIDSFLELKCLKVEFDEDLTRIVTNLDLIIRLDGQDLGVV